MWRVEWDEGNRLWLIVAPLGVVAYRTPYKWQAERWIEDHSR